MRLPEFCFVNFSFVLLFSIPSRLRLRKKLSLTQHLLRFFLSSIREPEAQQISHQSKVNRRFNETPRHFPDHGDLSGKHRSHFKQRGAVPWTLQSKFALEKIIKPANTSTTSRFFVCSLRATVNIPGMMH